MAHEPHPRLDPGRLQPAYDLLQDLVARGELPTGLLAVAGARDTPRCEAYGPGGAIPTDGIYWIASITKPVIATAIMQLVERGRLLIEDPVARHVPEFAVNGKEGVTLWHLLTHTSGLSDDLWNGTASPTTPELDLQGACAAPLRFPPGSRHQYSNPGFRVLGEVVRRASGQPHPDYLRREVFEPTGMAETTFRPDLSDPRLVMVPDMMSMPGGVEGFIALETPSGGLFSTAADLVAFGQAFLNQNRGRNGRLLSPAAIRVMTRLHTQGICSYGNGQPVPQYYGLSWEKAAPHEARLLSPSGFGHGGMAGTYLWIDPDADLVVVFLTNRINWDRRGRKAVLNAVMAALE